MSTRSVAAVALLAALVAALGFLLAGVPNVELVGLAAFVSGAAVGSRRGAAAGGLGVALYSGLNPYGAAPPPTFLSQVAGGALFGAAGGFVAARGHADSARGGRASRILAPGGPVLLGAAGLLLTLAYDGLTNYGTAVSIGAAADPWPVLVGGWAFGVWHVVWSTAFFATLGPPLLAGLKRRRLAGS